MRRLAAIATALAVTAVAGCGGTSQAVKNPFVARGGVESGPGSGLWGDGSSGPRGMHIGCIDGRKLAVLVTVHNRTKATVRLLGSAGPRQMSPEIERSAVQVSLAPPPKGDRVVSGLVPWSDRNSPPVDFPAGRDGWVQSDFLMRRCALLRGTAAVNRSIALRYRANGGEGTQVVEVPGARIVLRRGPVDPKLPINQSG